MLKGDSGTGKSTFCKLLSSLLKPHKGGIYLNGKDLQSYTESDLGKILLFVPQNNHLLNGSLLENITYGRRFYSKKRIEEALEKVELADLAGRLSQGVNTCIGEKGERLSGGEKQKLALARAFILRPNVLILDEATGSLDEKSEEKILDRLLEEIPTIFMVSHNLNCFDRFDRVLNFTFEGVREAKIYPYSKVKN